MGRRNRQAGGRGNRSITASRLVAALILTAATVASTQAGETEPVDQPIVPDLKRLLDVRPDNEAALVASLKND